MRTLATLAKLAFRNLRRHPRRTGLTVSTIAFGLTVLLWTDCMLEGRERQIIARVTAGATGHVQVYDHRYPRDHQLQFTMSRSPDRLTDAVGPGAVVARRVQIPVLVSSGELSATVVLRGIEPAAEASLSGLDDQVYAGEYLASAPGCDARQILLGRELARLLEVDVGEKVVLMTQTADGSLGSEAYRVRGLFDSGTPELNKRFAYGTLACGAGLANLTGAHEVAIRLPDERASAEVRRRLSEAAGPEFAVQTWREAMPTVASMIIFNHAMLALLTLILFAVVSLGVINTLLMSVFERTREFGVMMALGSTPGELGLVIALESVCLGLVAAAAATAVGGAILWQHARVGFDLRPLLGAGHEIDGVHLDTLIYPVIRYGAYLRNVGLELAVVTLASLYPAYRATRLDPVEALRHV